MSPVLFIDDDSEIVSTLQNKYPLTQWALNKWMYKKTGEGGRDGKSNQNKYTKDGYGGMSNKPGEEGIWQSSKTQTWWDDTPGFTTDEVALGPNEALKSYKFQAYFTIGYPNNYIHTSKFVTLSITPDENGELTYVSNNIDEDIPLGESIEEETETVEYIPNPDLPNDAKFEHDIFFPENEDLRDIPRFVPRN